MNQKPEYPEGRVEIVQFVVGKNTRVKITLKVDILHNQEVGDSAEAIRDAFPAMIDKIKDKLGIK